jgi:type II secretory pathway pseudopilin PulG
MVKNQRGYSIPELLAVIIITSIIIVPLMTSMIDNIATNYLLHIRRSSVSIADSTLHGFDKLDYTGLDAIQIISDDTDQDYYSEFNIGNCSQLQIYSADDAVICNALFAAKFNSVSFDSAHFRVFIYDYNVLPIRHSALVSNVLIPIEVRDEIDLIIPSSVPNPGLLRITVWIQYNDDPLKTTVISGLIIDDTVFN